MTKIEKNLNQTPLEYSRLVHHSWVGRHWKQLSLAVAALGGLTYLTYLQIRPYLPDSQGREITEASDPYKPAGTDSGIVIIPATSTATPPPTETPVSKTGYQIGKDGSISYKSETGEILTVPQIPGLKSELEQDNGQKKVIYTALKDNSYGLEADTYAGGFNPNVSVESKQTGGVVMIAPVVLKLMETNTKGLGLPLPLDVSEGQTTSISFLETEISGMYRSYMILTVSGKTPLTNILPDENELKIGKSIIKDANGQVLWQYGIVGSVIDDPKKIRPFKPYVLFPSKNFPNNVITVQKKFGDIVDEIEGSEERLSYGDGTKVQTLTNNDILTVSESPVFLAANTP